MKSPKGWWWQCSTDPSHTASFEKDGGIVRFLFGLAESGWDQGRLTVPCTVCRVGTMRITYEFPRTVDKFRFAVQHIVGLNTHLPRYLPMMWEAVPIGEGESCFDFKYIGRSPSGGFEAYGLARPAVFSRSDLAALFATYRQVTGRDFPEGSVNLFRSTRRLARGYEEDHLTEFVAAALATSAAFRRAYAELVLGAYARERGWIRPEIARVETQVHYPGARGQPDCWPDMRLTLGDAHRILCEHKIEAGETEGPGPEGSPGADQLERYLGLPADGLVYVRASWGAVAPEDLNHRHYVKPREGDHFLWRDFYPLFAAEPSDSPILGWLREGFEELGFTPPLPEIGDLDDPDEGRRRRNRENFAKLWGPTRSAARQLGWKIGTGSLMELYLEGNPGALARAVFISPSSGGRFLVRVTPRHEAEFEAVRARLERVPSPVGPGPEPEVVTVPRKEGPTRVVQVASTLRAILGDAGDPAEFERRLIGFVEPWLRALEWTVEGAEGKES